MLVRVTDRLEIDTPVDREILEPAVIDNLDREILEPVVTDTPVSRLPQPTLVTDRVNLE